MAKLNELQLEILKLKKEKQALILSHYYVPKEVHEIADHVGDSFALAKFAKNAEQKLIVVCGVRFMAESAKILSPDKKVLMPAPDAGCPMANMITPEDVKKLREEHPNAAVMCYVNSSAATKAVSDICCTSSSALRIAKSLKEDEIIFIPDKHLGSYTAKNVPDKKFILFNGFCPIHNGLTEDDVKKALALHPNAKLAVHPECREEVLSHADFIGSTAGILDYVRNSSGDEFIIGTESEITKMLSEEFPNKKIYSAKTTFTCTNMKKITLEAVYECLKYERFEINLSEDEINSALSSLDRMVRT